MSRRKLKVWNGHSFLYFDEDGNRIDRIQRHINVCAHTMKEAIELLNEFWIGETAYTFTRFWFPVWGYSMDGIEPEPGVWVEFDPGVPVRLRRRIG